MGTRGLWKWVQVRHDGYHSYGTIVIISSEEGIILKQDLDWRCHDIHDHI